MCVIAGGMLHTLKITASALMDLVATVDANADNVSHVFRANDIQEYLVLISPNRIKRRDN